MATLTYITNVSLDGYIEDAHGSINWGPPDDDVFATCTTLLRSVGTFLYGRRLYETMAPWETDRRSPSGQTSPPTSPAPGGRPTRSSTPPR